MIKLYKQTKIFILCPAMVATGGPEAIHQLAEKLIKLGHSAEIVYFPKVKSPTHERFKEYNFNYSFEVVDKKENILIVPETCICELNKYHHIQKAIWWLSIDNASFGSQVNISSNSSIKKFLKNSKIFLDLYRSFKKKALLLEKNVFNNKSIIHFAQSIYAQDYLLHRGVREVYLLTDYLNKSFFLSKTSGSQRKDFILYNPKKGREIVEKLIEISPTLKWVPLEKMTPLEVSNLMRHSKVYIDFGNHPGRDRIPREAAITGCCVLVGKKGSANFFQDVPIAEEYCFNTHFIDYNSIISKIKKCLKEYKQNYQNFEHYRNFITLNERNFELEIEGIFGTKNK